MATSFNFDATTVKPQESNFAPIPAGIYTARIAESEIKVLKSGNGQGLSLQFEIIEGQYANRRIFANLNVQHSNPTAESIGQAKLSQLCHSVGVTKISDTQQLHNIPLKIKVKIRPANDQYEARNEISAYESASGVTAPIAYTPPIAQAKSAIPAAAPWATKAA